LILSRGRILERLYHRDKWKRLTITPLDESQIGESSVDVRLSNRFIVMRRTNLPVYDPLSTDPVETYQERIVKRYGDPIVMHPGQLVLGGTVEYFRLPYDLCGEVVGKSSWGRLGVVVATATRVWPKYTGILTLELVNSGDVPVCLYPGSPIAQVTFSQVKSTSSERDRRMELSGGRYRCSIEPSFSLLRDDPCWIAIRRMRDRDNDYA